MATNDFLVFGGAVGANVIPQVTYSGLTARTAGFSAGVAQSAQLNKVWRQSSIMAAVLAQFLSDITGQDALDDGTTATLLANLKAAVRAQSVGVVGAVRNGKMTLTAASATATYTADEIILESALGGFTYRVPSFNKTINLATTGAGGMDTGSAPVSNFVAIYAIYNPTTGASALLGTAVGGVAPEVYGGANMPVGYTASALVAVHLTNGSGQLIAGYWRDREFTCASINVLTTNTTSATYASVPLGAAVPQNAKAACVIGQVSNTSVNTMEIDIAADSAGFGVLICDGSPAVGAGKSNQGWVALITAAQVFARRISGGGTPTFTVTVTGYRI